MHGHPVFDAEASVRQYYDENTRRFLAYGQGGGEGAIHRAVWGPGVQDRAAAFNYVNERLLLAIRALGASHGVSRPRVADLGCGIGASLTYLAARADIAGFGITLSPLQATLAQKRLVEFGIQNLECVQGSFLEVPRPSATFHVAYAIEAFIHAADSRAFFNEAARLLTKDGLLILCDDFLTESAANAGTGLPRRRRRWLDEYQRGWRVHALRPVSQLVREAVDFELCDDTDLTPYLELRRPRDYAIRWLVRAGRHLPIDAPWWGNFLGGNGLNRCLQSGVLGYRLLVFRKC